MVLTYAVSKYASEIEACRYWFFDGQIVLYDQIDTTLTYLELEIGLFEVVIVAIQPKIEDYIQLATKMAKEQTEYLLIH